MLYLSQLLGAPVEDVHGVRLGKLIDVLATAQVGQSEPAYPTALLVEGEAEQPWRVPLQDVERYDHAVYLNIPQEQLTFFPPSPPDQEVSLAHDVLDKQVIDIERKKAVRVDDVCLSDDWQILGIDNSTFGLVRRLAPAWLLGARSQQTPATLIPWENVELIEPSRPEEAGEKTTPTLPRLSSGQLAEMHPADIAEIVHRLTPGQGARLIEGLDDETAADTMEEIDTDRQRHILENIQPDRAADILDAMDPDEAADLLAQLPEERAQELLGLMTPGERRAHRLRLLRRRRNSRRMPRPGRPLPLGPTHRNTHPDTSRIDGDRRHRRPTRHRRPGGCRDHGKIQPSGSPGGQRGGYP